MITIAKTLEQINREYQVSVSAMKDRQERSSSGGGRKRKVITLLSNIMFYGAILALVLTAGSYTVSGGENPMFGYRIFNVLSGSMEGVYPKGSMVITQDADSGEIREGDDITYYTSQSMTITHRVIEVIEDYDGEGNRGFRTQGVANAQADAEIVHEYNVIGKVIGSIPMAGFMMQYMTEHLWVTVGMFVLCMVVSFLLRILIEERRKDKALRSRYET